MRDAEWPRDGHVVFECASFSFLELHGRVGSKHGTKIGHQRFHGVTDSATFDDQGFRDWRAGLGQALGRGYDMCSSLLSAASSFGHWMIVWGCGGLVEACFPGFDSQNHEFLRGRVSEGPEKGAREIM